MAILSRCKVHQRLRSIGKSGFRFEIRILDFAIKREIRTRFSPPRNSSSRWISIKKSKCGFHGFHFYRSIGKSEKGFAKLLAVFFLLIMRAHARPLNPDFLIERTLKLACENSGFSLPLGTFRRRNIPSREEKGEMAVFAGYSKMCGSRTYIHTHSMHNYSKFPGD